MTLINILAGIICIASLFAYVNYRFLRLPGEIGLMIVGLVAGSSLLVIQYFDPSVTSGVRETLSRVNFSDILLQFMLSFILFSGAMHTEFGKLKKARWSVLIYATAGVAISAFIIGGLSYFILPWLGLEIPFIYCLVFGALISPTDPVAVLGIIKKTHVPTTLKMRITGESLFNDGMGIALFLIFIQIAQRGESDVSSPFILWTLLREIGGGVVLGLITGFGGYKMIKPVNHYQTEVLVTLAMVTGGTTICNLLHLSAPIAMSVAGLFVGHRAKLHAMSPETQDHVFSFWKLIDMLFNAILFVLIGLGLLIIPFQKSYIPAGLILFVVVLLARYLSLLIPAPLLSLGTSFDKNSLKIMTWGGLRGGVSIALALVIPGSPAQRFIVTVTYIIALLSILIQGLTIGKVIRFLRPEESENNKEPVAP